MKHRERVAAFGILILIVSAAVLASCRVDSGTTETGAIAFVHANVIPMDRERVLEGHTVIVRDGRIDEVGPASGIDVPRGAEIVDAAGRYLIPALADMHVHLEGDAWNVMFPPDEQFPPEDLDMERLLFLYLANGVGTIHVMSALPEHVTARDAIAAGEILGPRMILSRMVDGPGRAWPPPISTWVDSAEEGRRFVQETKQAGYDRIKVYSFLDQPTYEAVVTAAGEAGMGVDGHVPYELSVEQVLEAGQEHIVHSEEILKHAGGDFSPERIDYFAGIIAESGAWVTPTLTTSRNVLAVLADPEKALGRPESRYLHPMDMGIWNFINTNLLQTIPPDMRTGLRQGFEQFQQPLTLALHEAGAGLMTGTDALLPGCVPGFSLHDELEEFTTAGMTPFEALRCSTTRPHEFLGEADVRGTIAKGKRADLVLLEKNPLEDIRNSRYIAGVMIQGDWFTAEEIRKTLDEHQSRASSP